MFGNILTYPFYVDAPAEKSEWGYSTSKVTAMEFEGIIDYVSGDRTNKYRTIHPDTTNVIIADFNAELFSFLQANKDATIRDGMDDEYTVLLVDNPGLQNHHIEIEVKNEMAVNNHGE